MESSRYPEKFKKIWRASFFGITIIWTVVIIHSSILLRGTGYGEKMIPVLVLGAAASIILQSAILRKYL